MIIDELAREMKIILEKYNLELKEVATIDEGEIEFEDGPNDILDECWEEFHAIANSVLPDLLTGAVKVSELPEILTLWGLDKFSESLTNLGEYKYLEAASKDLNPSNFSWDPFNFAIRKHFSLERIATIQNRTEFKIALHAFVDSVETYSSEADLPLEDARAFAIIAQMNLLKRSIFASYASIQDLDRAINEISPFEQGNAFSFVPLQFEGSSYGLESDMAQWIHTQISTEFLFGDDFSFDDNDQEVNLNLDSLKYAWLQKPEVELSEKQDHVWKIVAANLPAEITHEGSVVEFSVHCLYQLHLRSIEEDGGSFESIDNPVERYRVVLLHTGERSEYDSELDKCFLALQILVGAESLGTDIENIESEIDWLRLKEKDNPLLGATRKELEQFESIYLSSIEKK